MGLWENVNGWYEAGSSRNKNASLAAGFLFFAGWWILIDAMSIDTKHEITKAQIFIGVFATVSFFMVNVVKKSHIEENTSESGARVAKIWLLVALVMGFATIIAAIWIMVDYIKNDKDKWLGVAILLQNVFILFASLVFKFGRNEDEWVE